MRMTVAGGTAAIVAVTLVTTTPDAFAQTRRDRDRIARPGVMMGMLGSTIGAEVRDLNKDELTKAKTGGALIERVDSDGPAAKAGLKDGDVLVEFDGEQVRSARHLSRLVDETAEGRTVKATVVRGGSRQTLDVTPEARDRRIAAAIPEIQREVLEGLRRLPREFNFDFEGAMPSRGRLGVAVEPLTDQLADFFGAKTGVLVTSVVADSPAAKGGLKAGDVITSINGRGVDSPSQLTMEVRQLKPGASVDIGIVRDKKTSTLKATMEALGPRAFRLDATGVRRAASVRTMWTSAA